MTDIKDLWPTKLLSTSLDGAGEHNPGLLKLIRDWEKSNRDLTTDYRDNNPFEVDSEATNWLRAGVNSAVVSYLKACAIGYGVDWQIMGWANVNRQGDYHDPHNHPHSYLSGTYYVKVPTLDDRKSKKDETTVDQTESRFMTHVRLSTCKRLLMTPISRPNTPLTRHRAYYCSGRRP